MSKQRIAFQGEIGAYSEQAAGAFFDTTASELIPCPTFRDAFGKVVHGEAEAGVIPIENSLAGSVHENYDNLLEFETPIIGEVYLRISHHLMVLPGVTKNSIRRIISHPQALGQCRKYLDGWAHCEIITAYDTAGSAKMIREQRLTDTAAIASKQAASDYQLEIIASEIETNPHNYTRFLIIGREAAETQGAMKTSLVLSTRDIPGALFKTLAVFYLRDINLLKIESRPLHGKPFDYLFYLDIEGAAQDEPISHALHHLKEITTFLQVLGSYPRHDHTLY